MARKSRVFCYDSSRFVAPAALNLSTQPVKGSLFGLATVADMSKEDGNYFVIWKRLFNIAGIHLYKSKKINEALCILFHTITFFICVVIFEQLLNKKCQILDIMYSLGFIMAYVLCLSMILKRKQLMKVFKTLESGIFLPDTRRGRMDETKLMQEHLIFMNKVGMQDTEKVEENTVQWKTQLKHVVTYHTAILDVAKLIDEAFHLCRLVKFISLSVLFCLLIYGMSKVPISDGLFWMQFFYATFFIGEINVVYYYGNEIMVQSQGIANCCYDVYFVEADIRLQKALLLIIQRSQRPIQMTVGKFVPLSLATSIAMMRATYSYFMLLRDLT
ncbi:hypothetical protein FQR65_LT01901 [Abscondita terminalis]|nr:hypothetical protein FQR65_LT01901 [Abscondita terminalis]